MAKDPKDMSDKELEEAIANPPVEEQIPEVEVPVEPPKEDKKPEEKPVEETPKEEVEPEEETEEEEKPISRREKLRVVDLLNKGVTLPSVTPPVTDALDYEKELEADPETIRKLQEDRQTASEAMYRKGVEQANSIRFHTRLEIDAPRIETKYPQLDKTSDEFHPVLAHAINTMFLSAAGFDVKTDTVQNADLRYADYVESIFELANEIAGEKVESSSKKIAKQAAQAGLRPDGSSTKKLNLNKPPEQMTDEELDARIALAIPPR